MKNNYYIYIYLDSRKHGKYRYGEYEFDYEPFYVGKGKGRRYKRTDNRRSNYFKNKINKIKEYGLEPIIIKIKESLNERESFILESKLINLIGRKDLNKGPLINLTDGGEGTSGRIVSEETRKKKSGENHPMFGKHHSEETKRKQSESHIGKRHSNITKEKISKKLKGQFSDKNNPMYGKHHSEKSKIKMKYSIGNNRIGEKNSNASLTENDVILIKMVLCDFKNISQKEIAKIFNVTSNIISKIKNERTWSHIKLKGAIQ